MPLKLKPEHGAVEIKGLGIRLTQNSTEEEIQSALLHAPHLKDYVTGAATKSNKDGKAN